MDMFSNGITAYDPSEIKTHLTRVHDNKRFDLYGFSTDLKISYAEHSIFLHFQASSSCSHALLKELGTRFTFSISGDGAMKDFLDHFNGFEGRLELHEAGIVSDEIPQVTFKLQEHTTVII